MKTLILMRHAKSDWRFDQSDHDRPLNPRGRRAAPEIGRWLHDLGYLPDQIICSTAARTRETLDLLNVAAPTRFAREFYLAEPDTISELLRGAKGDLVLLIGHNPGIGDLAADLIHTPPPHSDFTRFPTCATLVVSFDIDTWADLSTGAGDVLDFIVPRDLTERGSL